MAGELAGNHSPEQLLSLVHDITEMCSGDSSSAATITGDAIFRKDCTDLVRRISLLTHLFEEIKELKKVVLLGSASITVTATTDSDSSDSGSWCSDLVLALNSAKRLLLVARNFRCNCSSVSFCRSNVFSRLRISWYILGFYFAKRCV